MDDEKMEPHMEMDPKMEPQMGDPKMEPHMEGDA